MNVMLVGVGGQGAILTSRILTQGLIRAGFDVKMSEVHGMAQRGGSVSTQVRYGEKVYSPLFGKGAGDVMVAFERMEALRYAAFLKPGGLAVVNDYRITPMSVAAGGASYPEDAVGAMAEKFRTVAVKAGDIAVELGNARCMNVVLFGALARALGLTDLPGVDWEEVVRSVVPEKLVELNLAAYKAGLAAGIEN
ncbi:MAG: indolepyruvate oxidoreductase subunit beta [Clostridiales Family XIII bacterium]|nr:indolepyruvate oxidoreductase subunit beta [Clostridiales Family XIII bacterium]